MWQTAKSTYRFCSFSELASFLREPDAHEWSAKTLSHASNANRHTETGKIVCLCFCVGRGGGGGGKRGFGGGGKTGNEREREKAFVIVRSPPPSFSLCGIPLSPRLPLPDSELVGL